MLKEKATHKEPSTAAFLNEYKGKDGQDISNPIEEMREMDSGFFGHMKPPKISGKKISGKCGK